MVFVYILESEDGKHWYVGITDNPDRRLKEHNDQKGIHTKKYSPWRLKTLISFNDSQRAENFERYLKSHSGRAFTKKHL